MLIACWSPKGGTGTTVVVACLDVTLIAANPRGQLLRLDAGGLDDPTGAHKNPPRARAS